jgi:hypothetical protein
MMLVSQSVFYLHCKVGLFLCTAGNYNGNEVGEVENERNLSLPSLIPGEAKKNLRSYQKQGLKYF